MCIQYITDYGWLLASHYGDDRTTSIPFFGSEYTKLKYNYAFLKSEYETTVVSIYMCIYMFVPIMNLLYSHD